MLCGWSKLHNKELLTLYSSINRIRKMKPVFATLLWHTERQEKRNLCRILVGEPGVKVFRKTKTEMEVNIRLNLRGIGSGSGRYTSEYFLWTLQWNLRFQEMLWNFRSSKLLEAVSAACSGFSVLLPLPLRKRDTGPLGAMKVTGVACKVPSLDWVHSRTGE